MTAEHDKKRTEQHVDRLMARLKAAERERDEMRAALAQPLTDEQIDIVSAATFLAIQDVPDKHVNGKTWDRMFAKAIELAHKIGAPKQPTPVAQIPDEATMPMLKAYGDALQAGCELDGSTVWRVMLAAARGVEPCSCDRRGIGAPGVTCGDCPRDYGSKA